MSRNQPYTREQLSKIAQESCRKMRQRVMNYRKKNHTYELLISTKVGFWDPPRVVVTCASNVPPFLRETKHQASSLKKCHPTLSSAYQDVGIQVGRPVDRILRTIYGLAYWVPGHCAEPHAANALLNRMKNASVQIKIDNIVFGLAFNVSNQTPKPYCGTCRLVFPQLNKDGKVFK